MNIDITPILQSLGLDGIFKVSFLVLVGLYSIFVFMLAAKIRSLNKIIYISSQGGRFLIQAFAFLYLLSVLSIFFLTLVIV